MVLPVSVLVIASASYVTRIVRASVADTLKRLFVRPARLKGLAPQRVILQHVLRNALIAPLTVILLQVNWTLTGVVVVEAIFAYPGIGSRSEAHTSALQSLMRLSYAVFCSTKHIHIATTK